MSSTLLVLCGLVVLFFASFLLGRFPVSPMHVIEILLSKWIAVPQSVSSAMSTVVWQIRLPRMCAAILVGGALAISGGVYQDLFKNPLIVSKVVERGSIVVLILGGIVISAVFQALISIIKYVADPYDTLPSIVFWLMGGLSAVNGSEVWISIVPICIPLIVLLCMRWYIQVISAGEEEARTLGVPVQRIRWIVILCATLLTASATSLGGLISWVGLLVPHMARMIVGKGIVRSMPAIFLLGGIFLLLVDDLCRTVGTTEIPLGIVTSLVGAPFFFAVAYQNAKRGILMLSVTNFT